MYGDVVFVLVRKHKSDGPSCLGRNFELKIYVTYVFVLGVPPDFARVLGRTEN